MSYEHGRFVWFELLTKDVERATSFYSETLPWKIESAKMQDGSEYSMIKVGEAGIGGLITPQGEVPTAWVSYVSVADVDETAKKVVVAGGTTHMEAFDVPGVGRMQPVSDAQGGMLQAPSSDVPTMWLQYIAVDDCDETLTRAKQNGATVIAEPVDAEGVGRFGIFRDPLGGTIGAIKPTEA